MASHPPHAEPAAKCIALVWSQFAAYHVDRCEAVAQRLNGIMDVLAVEIATTSADYAWEASGKVRGARKVTLYPGQSYDSVPWYRRSWALLRALRKCDMALIGLPYSAPEAIILSWLLRLWGVRVIMMTESKFDDFPRSPWRERMKALLLTPYRAAIVGGRRSAEYTKLLGFRKRIVLPGYDGVGLDRVRRQGGEAAPGGAAFANRPFIFVGRFVEKKNLAVMLKAYARYRALAGDRAHGLVLAGDGPLADELKALAKTLDIAAHVEFTGFLPANLVSQRLADSIALILVSTEEQWGLVVNEALAFGLPAIVSYNVGSRDALVRDRLNGYVVAPEASEDIARAMASLTDNEAHWIKLVAASHARAWMGDAERLADAVELLLDPSASGANARMSAFRKEMDLTNG